MRKETQEVFQKLNQQDPDLSCQISGTVKSKFQGLWKEQRPRLEEELAEGQRWQSEYGRAVLLPR